MMKFKLIIAVILYWFIHQPVICQTQVGLIDIDSLSHHWMNELGLTEIKENYQDKLRELGQREVEFLQKEYLQISFGTPKALTKEEIRKDQEELENNQKRIRALDEYPDILNRDFEEIRESLQHILIEELNSVDGPKNRMVLDRKSIIYAADSQASLKVNDKISREKVISKIEKLLIEKLAKVRDFMSNYRPLSSP